VDIVERNPSFLVLHQGKDEERAVANMVKERAAPPTVKWDGDLKSLGA
jgi:hypothetical protein